MKHLNLVMDDSITWSHGNAALISLAQKQCRVILSSITRLAIVACCIMQFPYTQSKHGKHIFAMKVPFGAKAMGLFHMENL